MQPVIGNVYKHESKLYKVIAIATHSETKKALVVYQSLAEDLLSWAQPLAEFCEGRFSEFDYYEGCCPKCGSEQISYDEEEDSEYCEVCGYVL
jgi:hypothetical protein